jgi:hypothetical protein
MKFTGFRKIAGDAAAAVLTLLAVSLIAGAIPASAQNGRVGELHIVKDCASGAYCQIVTSNLPELPAGTRIYYNQPTGGPTVGTNGFLDSTVFVYVSDRQWAVGRCTLSKDSFTGLCTLSDGVGPLAGFSARIVVAYKPGGSGYLFSWDGTYRSDPTPGR